MCSRYKLRVSTTADQAKSDKDLSVFIHHLLEVDYESLTVEHTARFAGDDR